MPTICTGDTAPVNAWPDQIVIERVAPVSPAAQHVLRAYTDEVASRYYGRQASEDEIDAALRDDPSDFLVSPTGVFLIARQPDGSIAGCAGMHLLPDRVGEVKRVYIVPAARGCGVAARLMAKVETIGREHGVTTLRLDTRADLVEARRFYARMGFVEIPAYNDGPYAEHWLAKALVPAAILISADQLPSLDETVDILSTPGALEEIR